MNQHRTRDAWLELATTSGIGGVVARRLIEQFATPQNALAASDAELATAGIPTRVRASLSARSPRDTERASLWLEGANHHFLTRDDPGFPRMLDELDGAPPWLYARGDPDMLDRPGIAIVGSRHPTAGGRELAADFARELAAAGLVVVSGLARGIDAAAHEGALAASGMTVAVCGTGLERVYPAANADLAERIAGDGVLVSEFNLDTPPARGNFPRRNRIIAGLTQATLVIEAARDSGSLITARIASEAGRDVFALPGSIHNPLARGCHRLIRDGAALVESVDQIFEVLAPKLGAPVSRASHSPEPAGASGNTETAARESAAILVEAMGHAPARIDELATRTGWNAADIASSLLILELEGRVVALPGGAYAPA